MFAKHANIAATKRATMCSIVKLKSTSKNLDRNMFATHATIAVTKRATMCSIVILKSIHRIQKKRHMQTI